ncbi:beta-hydroxyacyl-ACP dehydratase [Micromonospora sediminicola]|uniref:3-hydroxyacyl-ACP dehydratase FabZ family protein n=1 Tax=Micromonospora sediminicola TaxID=946078 RepID=UPI0033DE4B67
MRDIVDIAAVLPQRHPMLLVDKVLDLQPGRFIRTAKCITATEPCYADLPEGAQAWRYHYPRPMIIESFGQSAALLWLSTNHPQPSDGRTLMFVGATDFCFSGHAGPGDTLHHVVHLDSVIADTAFVTGETWAGDRQIAVVRNLVATRRQVNPHTPEQRPAPLPVG